MATYNGWANYDTWNVALWFDNDEGSYYLVRDYAKATKTPTYRGLIEFAELGGSQTPDGVAYLGESLDYSELDEWVREHKLEK